MTRATPPGHSARSLELALPGILVGALRWSPADQGRAPSGRHLEILHGVTGNAMSWEGVGRSFAVDGWTVDALDLPGHGRTRWTDDSGRPLPDQESVGRDRYGLRQVGEIVARALRALPPIAPGAAGDRRGTGSDGAAAGGSLESGGGGAPGGSFGAADGGAGAAPVLLGHSWGTGVAIMAVDAGAPVSRLILLEPPFMTPQQGSEMADSFAAELQPGLDLEAARTIARQAGDTGYALEARAHALVETSPLAADAISRGAPADPVALMVEWRTRHPDLPVDVIAGDPAAGGLIPAAMLRLLRLALGSSHVHELPGVGHSPNRDDLDRLLAVLREIVA